MFLKELYKAIGIELEVRNLLIDYKLDGRCMHVPLQVVGGLVEVTDDMIIETAKANLPKGSRICTIFEVQGDYEMPELKKLCASVDLISVNKRCVYMDRELAEEYVKDFLRN